MDRQQTKRTPQKCLRCRSINHLFAKCPKPPKYNKKWRKQFHLNERGNRASQKEYENGDNDNDQNIYAYMEQMSRNNKSSIRDFGGSL